MAAGGRSERAETFSRSLSMPRRTKSCWRTYWTRRTLAHRKLPCRRLKRGFEDWRRRSQTEAACDAGNITKIGHLKRAQDLLGPDIGGAIMEYMSANGNVIRYNVRTNEFAVEVADGTIRTLFRPKNGMACWLQQMGVQ